MNSQLIRKGRGKAQLGDVGDGIGSRQVSEVPRLEKAFASLTVF